jgi:hypothetical protein
MIEAHIVRLQPELHLSAEVVRLLRAVPEKTDDLIGVVCVGVVRGCP